MENVELKTPGGFTVIIRPDLTYGQYLELQEALTSKMSVDASTNSIKDISGSIVVEANRIAMRLLLVEVRDQAGNTVPNPVEAVLSMSRTDGQMVMAKINEITNKGEVSEKKEI